MDSKAPKWMGKRVAKASDVQDLERSAGVYEHSHGMEREQAEERAWKDYIKKGHEAGAAFHAKGMKTAKATGDAEEGKKHSVMYALHLQKLGLSEMDPLPEHIRQMIDHKTPVTRFKAHPSDALVMDD